MALASQVSPIEEREAEREASVLDDGDDEFDFDFGLNSGLRFEPTEELLRELDKGIDDMEAGRVRPHAETMAIIREQIRAYALRYHRAV